MQEDRLSEIEIQDNDPPLYKVIIIDDEAIIVNGLRRVVPWSKYHCEVVAAAGNVSEGTRLIRELEPDILFTDIRMPDGDGLSMLAGLRSEFYMMRITILTGYREFEYARRAVELGATRFLLKPSKMEDLIDALEAMIIQLGGEIDPHSADSASNYIVHQAINYIEEHAREKITLGDVAEACFISQWHLSKLLHNFANLNFYDLLNGARVAHAKRMLSDPDLRIAKIAEMVGFTDNTHFSKIFRRITGFSPNGYRNIKIGKEREEREEREDKEEREETME